MKVKVRFYASLREKLGFKEGVINLEGNDDFPSLTAELKKVIGWKVNIIVDEEGGIRKNLMVSVNNALINPPELAKLRFKNGDRVDIMPLPSGG